MRINVKCKTFKIILWPRHFFACLTWVSLYRVAHKKRPEVGFAITVRILYGWREISFCTFVDSMHCYLLQNFSDVINETIECPLLT